MDSGSSHNFLQARLAKQLGLITEPTRPLSVLVGNGDSLHCGHMVRGTQLHIQEHLFTVDFHLIDLSGTDAVLGIQWLRKLGPVLTDYEELTMKFMDEGRMIQLRGNPDPIPSGVSLHQLRKLLSPSQSVGFFYLSLTSKLSPSHSFSDNTSPEIQSLISSYAPLFTPPTTLPPSRPSDHSIPTIPNAPPIKLRPYRYPFFQKQEIEKQVAHMLDLGEIQPSNGEFSSPVLLVKKKDGSWRFCVDYRGLNAITIRDNYPIPTIDELLDELGHATWFSELDLLSGYHQIQMRPEDIHKTAFRTHDGHYEFRIMPFGLCSAPATFQSTMNDLLRPFLRRFAIVFFDDILIYSASWSEHLLHLELIFACLLQGQFYLKPEKCALGLQQIDYLGHIVRHGEVSPDPAKIHAMVEWPIPTSLKSLKGFLGLTGFYRKFIKGYALIAAPLTALLKKNAFQWCEEATRAFTALKKAMTDASMLALPDFSKPFVLQTDASGFGMGAVLSQGHKPIAFFSKLFSPKMLNSSVYLKELHAITTAVKKWRQYLLGHFFTIQTDHKPLKELLTQHIQTPEQQVYLSKLMGYNYEIQYKPGSLNVVADALSRREAECFVISVPSPVWLQQLKKELDGNPKFRALQQQLETNPSSLPPYRLDSGFIRYNHRLWIPEDCSFIPLLINEFHATPTGGHMGVKKTLARLQESFYWPNMLTVVTEFVRECISCQQTKYVTQRPGGLLQPLPLPNRIWEDLSMDFISGLPMSEGQSVIFVVVDGLSKGAHFGTLAHPYTAYKVAQLFITLVAKLHGMLVVLFLTVILYFLVVSGKNCSRLVAPV